MSEFSIFPVTIEPSGLQFDVEGDLSILEAAELGRVQLPSSCRNGTCRACMQQLESGRVAYRIEWPGLLPEEKAQGWILPCVAYPESDGVVRVAPACAGDIRRVEAS